MGKAKPKKTFNAKDPEVYDDLENDIPASVVNHHNVTETNEPSETETIKKIDEIKLESKESVQASKCSTCDEVFENEHDLGQHLKKVHPEKESADDNSTPTASKVKTIVDGLAKNGN